MNQHLRKNSSRSSSQPFKRHILMLAVSQALITLAIGAGIFGTPVASYAANTQVAKKTYAIPAGSLESTLIRFGRESGAMISYSANLVAGKQSPGLNGNYATNEALIQIFSGTGLQAVVEPNGGYSLRVLPVSQNENNAQAVTTLPAVNVAGTQETATGPVIGYRAKRSSTATKTDTSLAETLQSVTVVTRDQIVDQGATTLQDALTYAAGVRSDAYGLDSRTDSILVRGASPDTYIDGLRQTNDYYTSTARPDPYTMERIEVLRGPAAMMYGQGSTGGVLNLVSKRPLDTFQGEVGVQYGSHNRKQIQADITGPLSEDGQWLYRLVAVGRNADTQVDYVRDDRTLIAPTLTWKPNAATSLTLQGTYQKDKSGSTSQFLPWSGMVAPNPNGQVPTSRFIGEPSDRYDTERQSLGYLFEHRFNDDWTVRQNFRYVANEVDYFTHYARGWLTDPVVGGFPLDPVNQRIIERDADYSITKVRIATLDQHLQGKLQTGAVQHTLLAGLDVTRYTRDRASQYIEKYDTIDVYAPVYSNAAPISLTDEARSTQRQIGVYLQDQMKIGQQWIVSTGLRHDRVTNALAGSEDEKSRATTKRLGVMYLLKNGWSPYINYSESFTPVGGTDFAGARFKPVRGEQIEAGIKYMPADSNSQFTASVWSIDEKNQLRSDPLHANQSIQVGETKNQGLELEWKAAVTSTFDAIAHYNYTDLDDQLSAVPRHQAAAWGKWRFSVGEVSGLAFGAGVRYMSSFRDGVAPSTPSVTLLDALLSWDTMNWRYALNVNNLTDKVYNATCLSRGDCWYGARRSIVLTATYKF